ncbi:MAG TPA: HDOD domain-containing protein [Smithellaceae bacterium]|nr:HDOD domain-containing protein [Smithellaceae bacterium]HQM45121.1 HDOD domain-containing protein [Smithellaceae bacterium]
MRIVNRILKSIDAIPAFPATGNKVSQLLSRPDFSVAEVSNVIKYDPSITANILKMANSSYFGATHKISNISEAVMYLGQKNLLRAIQTAGISKYYKKGSSGYFDKATDLWEHSVAVALMSQILSRKITGEEDTTLYTAALLHDVGKIIMGEFVQEQMRKISMLVSQKMSFLEAEELVLGINHADLGGKIAEHWNFPIEIRDAISFHHRPDLLAKEDKIMPWIVYMADEACLMMGIGSAVEGLAQRAVSELLKKFNLKMRDLEKSMVLLSDDLSNARDIVSIV